ncbi:hypothetical protein GN956_G26191 [Arapaima gigas]
MEAKVTHRTSQPTTTACHQKHLPVEMNWGAGQWLFKTEGKVTKGTVPLQRCLPGRRCRTLWRIAPVVCEALA